MKICGSLPQELEDEAVLAFDRQGDQLIYNSAFLLRLTSEERQSEKYEEHYMAMFWFVFGYGIAKGWKRGPFPQ